MILVFLVSERSKTKIQFNGREYASADEMPVSVGAAYDRAVDDTPLLHSGARLAAKLNAIKPKKVWLIAVVVSNFCRSYLSLAARLLRLER